MIPFIGVRISWLMFATNSLLARLADVDLAGCILSCANRIEHRFEPVAVFGYSELHEWCSDRGTSVRREQLLSSAIQGDEVPVVIARRNGIGRVFHQVAVTVLQRGFALETLTNDRGLRANTPAKDQHPRECTCGQQRGSANCGDRVRPRPPRRGAGDAEVAAAAHDDAERPLGLTLRV
jgi:hypothetical protein